MKNSPFITIQDIIERQNPNERIEATSHGADTQSYRAAESRRQRPD